MWAFPLLFTIVFPRVLSFTNFTGHFMVNTGKLNMTISHCSSEDARIGYLICGSTLFGFLLVYFESAILLFFFKGVDIMKHPAMCIRALALGIFGPCIVLHPDSLVLMITSLASAFAHVLLCISLLVIGQLPNNSFTLTAEGHTKIVCVIISLIASLSPSYIMHHLSFEDNRQENGLILSCHFWSLSCDDDQAFIWACENDYPHLLQISGKFLNKSDKVGHNAVQVACKKGKGLIIIMPLCIITQSHFYYINR